MTADTGSKATAKPQRGNWFGLKCKFRLCGFRPNNISFGPIGAHCTTAGCGRQHIIEDDWRGRWPRRGADHPVNPREPANAE